MKILKGNWEGMLKLEFEYNAEDKNLLPIDEINKKLEHFEDILAEYLKNEFEVTDVKCGGINFTPFHIVNLKK